MTSQDDGNDGNFVVPDFDELDFGDFDAREGGGPSVAPAPVADQTPHGTVQRVGARTVASPRVPGSAERQPAPDHAGHDGRGVLETPSHLPQQPVSQPTTARPDPVSDRSSVQRRPVVRQPADESVHELDPARGHRSDEPEYDAPEWDDTTPVHEADAGYGDWPAGEAGNAGAWDPELDDEYDDNDEYDDSGAWQDDEFEDESPDGEHAHAPRRAGFLGRGRKDKAPDQDDHGPVYDRLDPPKPTGKAGRGWSRGEKKPKKAKGQKEQKLAYAGGRGKLLLLRGIVFAGGALIVLAGMRAVFLPSSGPTDEDIAAMVAEQVSYGGFPVDEGSAFALMCADAFLTYDPDTRDIRKDQLTTNCTTSSDSFLGWNGQGAQEVVAGPFMASPPEIRDKNNAFFTIAAKVTNGGWIHLSVPVYADETGKLAMPGVPALVPPPALADPPGGAGIARNDSEAQAQLTAMLPGFFTAWGASDTNSLDRYVTRDADPSTLNGLRGSVILDSVDSVRVPEAEGANTRVAEVEVTWQVVPDGGLWEQSYRVTVVSADGSWFVQSVDGAVSLAGPVDGSESQDAEEPGTSVDAEG